MCVKCQHDPTMALYSSDMIHSNTMPSRLPCEGGSTIILPPIIDVAEEPSLKRAAAAEQDTSNKRRRVSVSPSRRRAKTIKKVRFNSDDRIQELSIDPEVKERCWIPKQEMEISRKRAKCLALEISTTNHMRNHELSYKNVFENAYKHALQGKQPSDSKALSVWVAQGHSRRGLERWSLPLMSCHRQERRNKLVETLMTVQKQAVEEKGQTLCRVSRHYSKPARVFARALGAADAHAAAEGNVEVR